MKVVEKLNAYVNENDIKQIYIAQKTGLDEDTVSDMLNGNRQILADEFLMICIALDIDPNIFRNNSHKSLNCT